MDAGAGLLDVLDALPAPTTVLCDVRTTLYDAPRVFGPQKGATPAQVAELEARFRAYDAARAVRGASRRRRCRRARGRARVARRRARTRSSARARPRRLRPARAALVVTGEGRVDATTAEGKVAAEVVRRCAAAGVPCVVFGGVVEQPLPGVETVALSGDPARARHDLYELGRRLGTRLLDAAG